MSQFPCTEMIFEASPLMDQLISSEQTMDTDNIVIIYRLSLYGHDFSVVSHFSLVRSRMKPTDSMLDLSVLIQILMFLIKEGM